MKKAQFDRKSIILSLANLFYFTLLCLIILIPSFSFI